MILIPALPLALVFITAVLFAAVCIALGWLCHMLYDAENQPPKAKPVTVKPVVVKQTVIAPWSDHGEPPTPAYRPSARLSRHSYRCANRLPAAPVVNMAALAEPTKVLRAEFPLIARARFYRTDAGLRKEADALTAKRHNRTMRNQAILAIPTFEGAVA